MTRRPGFISALGIVAAVLVFVGAGAVTYLVGPGIFSPGGLSAQTSAGAAQDPAASPEPLGGVTSHAELGDDCGACHPAPWSPRTMADACVECHTRVGEEISAGKGLHGGLAGAGGALVCTPCHPEHGGPDGPLTAIDEGEFRAVHEITGFPLEGAHAATPCAGCHEEAQTTRSYRGAPRRCYGCHAEDDEHEGAYGRDCGSCHTASAWDEVTFDHDVFPLDHGEEERRATCATCHPRSTDAYTCDGCHEHSPARVLDQHEGQSLAELEDCVRCHPGGREAEEEEGD
jgi:hypothetical protein